MSLNSLRTLVPGGWIKWDNELSNGEIEKWIDNKITTWSWIPSLSQVSRETQIGKRWKITPKSKEKENSIKSTSLLKKPE